MKVVVQRSLHSSVIVNDEVVSTIPRGMVLLICMEKGDSKLSVEKAADKILNLRINIQLLSINRSFYKKSDSYRWFFSIAVGTRFWWQP